MRNLSGKVFAIKTAALVWIIYTILYGGCLYFISEQNGYVLADLLGGISWVVCAIAYVISIGAIIKTLIDKTINIKKKIIAILLVFFVYFASTGVLYLFFSVDSIEAGDWSEWTTEQDFEEME